METDFEVVRDKFHTAGASNIIATVGQYTENRVNIISCIIIGL